jgi:hypothetical protein
MYHEEPLLKVAIIMKCGAGEELLDLFTRSFSYIQYERGGPEFLSASQRGLRIGVSLECSSAPRPTGAGSASPLTTVLLYPYPLETNQIMHTSITNSNATVYKLERPIGKSQY